MRRPRAAQICRTRPMEAPGLPRSTSLRKRGLRPSMEASSSMLRPACFRRARMSCPHSAGVLMWFAFIPDGELLLENAAKSSLFIPFGNGKRTGGNGFELIDFPKRCHFSWEGNELRPKSVPLSVLRRVRLSRRHVVCTELSTPVSFVSFRRFCVHSYSLPTATGVRSLRFLFISSVRMIIHRWLRTAEQ